MAISSVTQANRGNIKMLTAALEQLPDSATIQHALADLALESNAVEPMKRLVDLHDLDRDVARRLATSARHVSVRSAAYRNVDWTPEEMLSLLEGEKHAKVRHEAFRIAGLPDEVYRELASGSKPIPSRLLPAASYLPLDVLVRAYETAPAEASYDHPVELLDTNPDLTLAVAARDEAALPWRIYAAWVAPAQVPGSHAEGDLQAAVEAICAAVDGTAVQHEKNKPWAALGELSPLREVLNGSRVSPPLEDLTSAQRRIVATFARYGICASPEYMAVLTQSADDAHRLVQEFLDRDPSVTLQSKDVQLLQHAFRTAAAQLTLEEAHQALTRASFKLDLLRQLPADLAARFPDARLRAVTVDVIAQDRCPAWLAQLPDAHSLVRPLGPNVLATTLAQAHKAGDRHLADIAARALLDGLAHPVSGGAARSRLEAAVTEDRVSAAVLHDVPLAVVLSRKSKPGARLVERLVESAAAAGVPVAMALETLRTISDGDVTYGATAHVLEAALGVDLAHAA